MKIVRSLLFVACALLIVAAAAGQAPSGCSGSGSTLRDFLSSADTARAEQFLTTLQAAFRSDDKAMIAAMVEYPLRVNLANHTHRSIQSAQQFKARFDWLFTPGMRDAILAQAPACMFARDQGVMIGDGQVWFQDFKGTFRIWSVNRMETVKPATAASR